jgi:hypothetical protein
MGSYTVAACAEWGCSLCWVGLQPPSHRVAALARVDLDPYGEGGEVLADDRVSRLRGVSGYVRGQDSGTRHAQHASASRAHQCRALLTVRFLLTYLLTD